MNTNDPHANKKRLSPRFFRSLRARLLITVNLVVSIMVIGAVSIDYSHELDHELKTYKQGLSDEARSLLPGVEELMHHGVDTVQSYIDEVCAQMKDKNSPGHHIMVEMGDELLQAQSHHRASSEIAESIYLAADIQDGWPRSSGGLIVGHASHADTTVYVSEESAFVFSRIRHQAIIRLVTLTSIGVAGALIVNFILLRLVTRPIDELVRVVHKIGSGEFGIVPKSFSTNEFALLSGEIGKMSTDLAAREKDRSALLSKARRIQQHLLPKLSQLENVRFSVEYRPADTVAGDYYDVMKLSDGSVLICLADVCGHGVPAAMGAAILKTLLISAVENERSLPQLLHEINTRFCKVSLPEDFASMALLRIDPENGLLEFASAGHEPAYILNGEGVVETLHSTGMVLGVSPNASWMVHDYRIGHTDRVVLLTDGVSEAPSKNGKRLGRLLFLDLLETLSRESVTQITDAFVSAIDHHSASSALEDDQTMVAIQILESVSDQVGL